MKLYILVSDIWCTAAAVEKDRGGTGHFSLVSMFFIPFTCGLIVFQVCHFQTTGSPDEIPRVVHSIIGNIVAQDIFDYFFHVVYPVEFVLLGFLPRFHLTFIARLPVLAVTPPVVVLQPLREREAHLHVLVVFFLKVSLSEFVDLLLGGVAEVALLHALCEVALC